MGSACDACLTCPAPSLAASVCTYSDGPNWDKIFADELQAPVLAAPLPPPVALPPLESDAPLVNRKRARSDFTNESNLSRDEENELRQLNEEIVAIQSEEEALEEGMAQREVKAVRGQAGAAEAAEAQEDGHQGYG